MKPSILFEHVSKRYSLGRRRTFLRELLPHSVLRRVPGALQELWALKDVSFDVEAGEIFGIIGSNGSGKTTTLSLLAGVTEPTEGSFSTAGNIGALIQLGAGFHPEFTGKENVYLNASILGTRRSTVDRIYGEIVEFAGLEPFMDTPVKRYSSGMYARLAFSVAIHMHPDILLVDEVLAVGDMPFQTKCLQKMLELSRSGHIVVFVSHNLNMVQNVCHRVMWLEAGRCVRIGTPSDILRGYLNEMDRQQMSQTARQIHAPVLEPDDVRVDQVLLRDQQGNEHTEFRSGEPLTVEVHFQARKRIEGPYFWIAIHSIYGTLFAANMLLDGERPESIEGNGVLCCTFRLPRMLPQVYGVRVGIRSPDGATFLIVARQFAVFRVVGDALALGLKGNAAESLTRDSAPVLIPYEWRFPDGQVRTVEFKESTGR